jgi:transposase InsO family protein
MRGATLQATFQSLGIIPSFNRPSVSNDNAYSASIFKTVKYNPKFPTSKPRNVGDWNNWFEEFVTPYNTSHYHGGIKFVAPTCRHELSDLDILQKRTALYERARAKTPERWNGKNIRDWSYIPKVILNPDLEKNLA